MAPRRRFDRAPLDSRSYREPLDGRIERYDVRDDRYDARNDRYTRGYEPREARYDRYDRSFDRPAGPSELDQDFAAMKRVWQMLRAGASAKPASSQRSLGPARRVRQGGRSFGRTGRIARLWARSPG